MIKTNSYSASIQFEFCGYKKVSEQHAEALNQAVHALIEQWSLENGFVCTPSITQIARQSTADKEP